MARLLLDHLAIGRAVPFLPTELRREIYRRTFPRACQACGACGAPLLSYGLDADERVVMAGGAPYTVLDAGFRCLECVDRLLLARRAERRAAAREGAEAG